MRLVHQRQRMDCVLACLCMATGLPYARLLRRFFPRQDFTRVGVAETRQVAILRALGYRTKTKRALVEGVPALVTVPSLNIARSLHCVFFDGKKIRDPNRGREGKRYYVDVGPRTVRRAVFISKKFAANRPRR